MLFDMHNGLVSKARLTGLLLLLAVPHFAFGQSATFVAVPPLAFPQIAIGGDPLGTHYVTFLRVVNNTSAPTIAHVELFSDTGSAFYALVDGAGPMSTFDVSFVAGETAQVAISSTGEVAAGWMKVTYSPAVALTSVLVQYLSGNTLLSQVGVDPAFNTILSTDLSFENDTSLNNGVALSNPSADPEYISAWLYDSGGQVVSKKPITLPANGHTAQFLTEIFADVPNIAQMRAKVTLYSCSASDCMFLGGNGFIATALRLYNDQLTTIPIIDRSLPGNLVRFLPQVAFGGPAAGSHMSTVLYFTTNVPAGAIATADIFDDNGNPLPASANGGVPASSITFAVLSNRVTKFVLTGDDTLRSGWIRLTLSGTVNLVTNAVFQTFNGNSLVSEASVLESPAVQLGVVYVDTNAGANVGVAFGNPGTDTIDVVLDLFDQQGKIVAQHDVGILANGHLARFVTEYFPEIASLPAFTGSMAIHCSSPFSALALRLAGDKLATTPISTAAMHLPSITGLRTTASQRSPLQVSFSVDLADADADLPDASSMIAADAAVDFGVLGSATGSLTIDGTAMLNRTSGTLSGTIRLSGTVPAKTPAVLYLRVYDSLGNASNVVSILFSF